MKGLITPTNGRTADETPTATVPKTPQGSSKTRIIIASIAATLVVAAAAVAVVLATSSTTATAAKTDPVAAYQQKLSSVLTPVVAANQALSVSLQALSGSKTSIRATKTATTNAQQALTSAGGAVAIITVPAVSTQLSQQAAQALTQENGFLQSVSTTLGDPTGNAVASVQPLASATSSAFVPLASVAPGGATSISGVDNLLKWAAGAVGVQKAIQHPPTIINTYTTTNNVTPTPPTNIDPAPPVDGPSVCPDTVGNNDISVGSTSCAFAKDVLIAAATYYQDNHALPDGTSLSVDGLSVYYTLGGDTIDAASSDGGSISFSSSLANGTGPG